MSVSLNEEQVTTLFREVAELKTAYQIILADGPASRAVLLDLARFCRGDRNDRHVLLLHKLFDVALVCLKRLHRVVC